MRFLVVVLLGCCLSLPEAEANGLLFRRARKRVSVQQAGHKNQVVLQQVPVVQQYAPVAVNPYPIAAQGNTVYGYPYGVQQQVDLSFDVQDILDQSSRLVTQAQQLAGQAHADYTTQVQTATDAQARIAAAALFSEGFSKAMEGGGPTYGPMSFTFNVAPAADGTFDVNMSQAESSQSPAVVTLHGLISQKCVRCHDGDQRAVVTDMPLTQILRSVYQADPEKRMPKGGDPLTDDEISLFLGASQ